MSSYYNINSKNDTFASYIASPQPHLEVKDQVSPPSTEAYSDCNSRREGYTAADFSNLVSSMSGNRMYDMSSNLLYNPSNPEYIPTLREAAIEDKNQLIVQQNTMLALGAMSAASIAIVLYMISNRS